LEDDQKYFDWESGRVAKEEMTLEWEKTNEGKGYYADFEYSR
jgi:hypothetical protein